MDHQSLDEKLVKFENKLNQFYDQKALLSFLIQNSNNLGPPWAPLIQPKNLIPGCQVPIWIDCLAENGKLNYQMHSESRVINGLLGLLEEIFQRCSTDDVRYAAQKLEESSAWKKNMSANRRLASSKILNKIIELSGISEASCMHSFEPKI